MSYRGYYRHNRVLIGGRSKNLGGHNLLAGEKRSDGDTPRFVMLGATIEANGEWTLRATWLPPDGDTPLNYEIELRQTEAPVTTYGNRQTASAQTYSYTGQLDGVYQVRVRANYGEGPSEFIESNIALAFINLSFNWGRSPSFHTVQT